MLEFQTSKTDFANHRLVTAPAVELRAGEVKLNIESFSFTANNITYAVAGEMLRYWQFFPASDNAQNEWGIIPVWGFATVAESLCDDVAVGERLFGYFPPAEELIIQPTNITKGSLFDGAQHRADLPPDYNIYRKVEREQNYDANVDQERMLLFPLYLTGFCLHDMLHSNNWFSAEQVIIASASSKTSIGLAYAIAEDDTKPHLVGLTSSANKPTVENIGIYDEAVSYAELTSINASLSSVIVDMSGNSATLGRLHTHLGDNMKFCSNVGMTHWEDTKQSSEINHERSKMFFAPDHIQMRMQEWGAAEFNQKTSDFIMRTAKKSRSWLDMHQLDGLTGLASIYADVCNGQVTPEKGIIINL